MARTSFMTMPSTVGIVARAPAVDEKCDVFYLSVFCLSRFGINYEVCDNENAMKQCNFQNNYSAIA